MVAVMLIVTALPEQTVCAVGWVAILGLVVTVSVAAVEVAVGRQVPVTTKV